jgi:hypothetical protein
VSDVKVIESMNSHIVVGIDHLRSVSYCIVMGWNNAVSGVTKRRRKNLEVQT